MPALTASQNLQPLRGMLLQHTVRSRANAAKCGRAASILAVQRPSHHCRAYPAASGRQYQAELTLTSGLRRTSRSLVRAASSPSGKDASPQPTTSNSGVLGYAALFGVALLWGSYTPAIKLLYDIEPPPDPPLLNALQACLSALFLIAANITASITHRPAEPHPEMSNPMMAEDAAARRATLSRDSQAQAAAPAMTQEPLRPPSNIVEQLVSSALNWQATDILVVGSEVGLWMCLAFGFEVAGVQLTSATKAAFLNQASVLITPVLVHLSGARVRGIEWIACGLGLLGSGLVAADSFLGGTADAMEHGASAAAADAANNGEALGLVFVLVSAVFFALSTVRLGRYSAQFEPLTLSTASTSALGVLSLAWLAASILDAPDGWTQETAMLSAMAASPACLLTLIWVGMGPGALAAFLQAVGQKSVPPAQAQVIYSTTPLWAAGFALLTLDASDEAMGPVAWAGAAVMLASSLVTALSPPSSSPTPTAAPAAATAATPPSSAADVPAGGGSVRVSSPGPGRRSSPPPSAASLLQRRSPDGGLNGGSKLTGAGWPAPSSGTSLHAHAHAAPQHATDMSSHEQHSSRSSSSSGGSGWHSAGLPSSNGHHLQPGQQRLRVDGMNGSWEHAWAAQHTASPAPSDASHTAGEQATHTWPQAHAEGGDYGRTHGAVAGANSRHTARGAWTPEAAASSGVAAAEAHWWEQDPPALPGRWGALSGPRAQPPPLVPLQPEQVQVQEAAARIEEEVRVRQGLMDVM